MAKVTGQSSDLSGKVGTITYMQTKYGTVAFPSKKKAKTPRRSEKQMYIRTQWVNLGAVYRQFHKTLKKAYEDVGLMSVYNAFVQANINVVRVYITKQERLNGGSVLAPYLITRGSIPSINWTVNGDGKLVTDIALGSLVIGAQTTVAQFSIAVVQNNEDWQMGDQITFFYGIQTVDATTHVPRAKIAGFRLVLDTTDMRPLWSAVNQIGFASVQEGSNGSSGSSYCLGMSEAIANGAAAWVHTRDEGSNLLVSSQYLYVDSAILDSYMDGSAFDSSVNSYGGINTSAVFLDPNAGRDFVTVDYSSGSTDSTDGTDSGSGSGSNTNGSNGTNTGGSSGSGSNGSSGSSSSSGSSTGGSETVTVAAPVFSGETQFTETTQVTMTAETGASIRYTTDGSTPTATSGTAYSGPVTLSETTTVKAIAVKDGVTSDVTSRTYSKVEGTGGGTGGEDEPGGDDH